MSKPYKHTMPEITKTLTALTSSALVLPGLIVTTSIANAAEGDEVDFQYSHYQEGRRDIYGINVIPVNDPNNPAAVKNSYGKTPSHLAPIEVDSLHGRALVSFTDRVKFAFNYLQDTWSGATPIGTAPAVTGSNYRKTFVNDKGLQQTYSSASPYAKDNINYYLDKKGDIHEINYDASDPVTGQPLPGQKFNQLSHVMSYASPETRKQGDFKLSYDWDEASAGIGGGISTENDYESRFLNLVGRLDFNRKRTSVNFGVSYTNSTTHALVDPDGIVFFDLSNYIIPDPNSVDPLGFPSNYVTNPELKNQSGQLGEIQINPTKRQINHAILRGIRQDIGLQVGLSQVLDKDSVLTAGLSYTRSTGYLGNPYKLVYVSQTDIVGTPDPNQPLTFSAKGRLETRPDERILLDWSLGYTRYIEPLDAAWHFNYRFAHDNWNIHAHTFESDWVQPVGAGWTLTPRIRYYSQSQAYFYAPYVTVINILDLNTGLPVDSPFSRKLPDYYSSDQRLSGFGTLSGGITVAKQFAKGLGFEAGFEYYTHQGGLKIGGGGEGKFADYDYWVANAGIKLNLDALSLRGGGSLDHAAGHHGHRHDSLPAGVMFGHTLDKAGDFMAGYRFMRNEQAGGMLHGSAAVDQDTVVANGCGEQACNSLPTRMAMNMHMLDLMYAPADWLTLMLMPQWMDMDMDMNHLNLGAASGGLHHSSIQHVPNHQTGGLGDTGVYALFKLFDWQDHHLNLSLGGTAPTGDVDVILRKTAHNASYDTPIHYGMQLGSGTWDFKPSLTYSGDWDRLSWGAQLTGTKRLEKRNSNHFVFGDIFQASAWGGVHWTDWLATTVRGIYTAQGAVRGHYAPQLDITGAPLLSTHVGPFDSPANYGGDFVDLGLGVNMTVPSGTFAGNSFKFEWLQPVSTHYKGYQLDRDYALNFTWSYGF